MGLREVRYCACGTRLARDNYGAVCGACLRKGRAAAGPRPPRVPDDFWRHERMSEALQRWHMGQVFYAYRTHPFHGRVLSQDVLAEWLGLTQAHVSRIENGSPPRDLEKLTRWAHVLGIPESVLWFKLPRPEAEAGKSSPADAEPALVTAAPGRALLAMAAAANERLSAPGTVPEYGVSAFAGMSLQESGEHLIKLFLHLDDELGGDGLYAPLAQYVNRMAVSVRGEPRDGLQAFGQLNQMVGWLALDADKHGHAKRYFAEAVEVGHESGDSTLAASALGYMSLQETYRGRPVPARALAEMAFALSPEPTPLVRTVLGTRLARALARLGDEDCLRVLETMRADFGRAGQREEPQYVSYVGVVEVAAQQGACYLDLGMTEEAAAALTEALELLAVEAPHRTRDRVHYMARLARCRLLDGEVEEACRTGREALALSRTIGSARVAGRLRELRTALSPFGRLPCVEEFEECFRLVTAGRPV